MPVCSLVVAERPEKHHASWKRNAALADRARGVLGDDGHWEIVFRFYASLHLVEGYMRTKAERFWSERHETRTKALRDSPEVKNARAPYRDLEDLSQDVRYDPGFVVKEDHFAKAKDWSTRVEGIVRPKLENALKKTPGSGVPPSA